jgi:hypothetical protein
MPLRPPWSWAWTRLAQVGRGHVQTQLGGGWVWARTRPVRTPSWAWARPRPPGGWAWTHPYPTWVWARLHPTPLGDGCGHVEAQLRVGRGRAQTFNYYHNGQRQRQVPASHGLQPHQNLC